MILRISLAAVGALIGTVPLEAQPRQQPAQDVMESLSLEKGTCRSLVTMQQDKSSKCISKLFNTTWRSGRAGFYFMTEDNEAITFSGMGTDQIHPNPDIAVQPIDEVIFGNNHEVQKAVGSCRFTNPFHGKATVVCEATTEVGDFKGSFETDGSPPNIKKF